MEIGLFILLFVFIAWLLSKENRQSKIEEEREEYRSIQKAAEIKRAGELEVHEKEIEEQRRNRENEILSQKFDENEEKYKHTKQIALDEYNQILSNFNDLIYKSYSVNRCSKCNNPLYQITDLNDDCSGMGIKCNHCNKTMFLKINEINDDLLNTLCQTYNKLSDPKEIFKIVQSVLNDRLELYAISGNKSLADRWKQDYELFLSESIKPLVIQVID